MPSPRLCETDCFSVSFRWCTVKIRVFQGLFVKAVVVLGIISLVPVLFIGYRVMRINGRLLTNELLQKQQMVANRLASAVRSALSSKEQLLTEFGDLHTDFGSYRLITQPDLDYLRARNPSLFYLAVFSTKGTRIFALPVFPFKLAKSAHRNCPYRIKCFSYLLFKKSGAHSY